MVMAGSDDIDHVQVLRRDDQFTHAHMGFGTLAVFGGEGIRKVRVKEHAPATPLQQETTLPQPPDINLIFRAGFLGGIYFLA
jgi:hypothetical protein